MFKIWVLSTIWSLGAASIPNALAQTVTHIVAPAPVLPQKEATAPAADAVWMPVLNKMIFRDSADVIWFDFPVSDKLSWVKARALCALHKLTLPSREQLEYAKPSLLAKDVKRSPRAPTFWVMPDEGRPPNFRHHFVSHMLGPNYDYYKADDTMTDVAKVADVVRCVYQSEPFVAPSEPALAADIMMPLK